MGGVCCGRFALRQQLSQLAHQQRTSDLLLRESFGLEKRAKSLNAFALARAGNLEGAFQCRFSEYHETTDQGSWRVPAGLVRRTMTNREILMSIERSDLTGIISTTIGFYRSTGQLRRTQPLDRVGHGSSKSVEPPVSNSIGAVPTGE